ncbi:hypothetical protein LCGC14_2212990 [marine sediment metagenome]|uniref:Uncharacterized protein n=1 Tax=marine sediment metagenome TaxID=412755 RepID=A0A0F9DD52_9ZZZZ
MNTRDSREQAIKLLEACKTELQTKAEQAQRDLEAVEHSIHLLRRGIGPEVLPAEDGAAGLAYADLRPQQAVRKFFREHPQQPHKPSVVAKKLRHLGFRPTTVDKNVFVTQVRTACLRLTEKGVLERTAVDGRVAFQSAKESSEP